MPKPRQAKQPARWTYESIPLVRLHLDLQNYRHDEVANEAAAIDYLWKKEKVEALARDIASQGSTSPMELLGVVPMADNPGHFIAVEGNRRVCSLLLLNDPDKAPTPAARATMREIADAANLPSRIDVVVFPSKQEAKHWIDLRHLGPQDGQGMRPWNPVQKERAAAGSGSDALAVQVLDRARQAGWITPGQRVAVSTLTRYLKNREVRAALGLGHHRDLVFTHEPAEVDAALKAFVHDSLPRDDGQPAPVNSRSKDADRAAYARALRDRGVAPSTALAEPITPPTPSVGAVVKRARNPRNQDKRPTLMPSGFLVRSSDPNLQALTQEMRATPIDNHEFATAYLLRAFIERVAVCYVRKLEPSYNWGDDHALMTKCSLLLDSSQKVARYKGLRVAVSKTDCSWNLHTLGAVVHASIRVDRTQLLVAWHNWEPALQDMLAAL